MEELAGAMDLSFYEEDDEQPVSSNLPELSPGVKLRTPSRCYRGNSMDSGFGSNVALEVSLTKGHR